MDGEIRSVPCGALVPRQAQGGGGRLHGSRRLGGPRRGHAQRGQAVGGGLQHDESAEARTSAANDNALTRIARDVQRTAFAWRHGAAVDAFAAGRQEVLTSWNELRQMTRADGDAVALGDTYRETLDRHAALLKAGRALPRPPGGLRAAAGRARACIGRGDLDEFEALHERARRHRNAAAMRQVHRRSGRDDGRAWRPGRRHTRTRELALERARRARSTPSKPPDWFASVPPPTDEDLAEARAAAAREAREDLAPPLEPREPEWLSAWEPADKGVERADRVVPGSRARSRSTPKGYVEADPAHPGARGEPPSFRPGSGQSSGPDPQEPMSATCAARKRIEQFLDAAPPEQGPAVRSRRGGGRGRRGGHANPGI